MSNSEIAMVSHPMHYNSSTLPNACSAMYSMHSSWNNPDLSYLLWCNVTRLKQYVYIVFPLIRGGPQTGVAL